MIYSLSINTLKEFIIGENFLDTLKGPPVIHSITPDFIILIERIDIIYDSFDFSFYKKNRFSYV